MTESQIERKLKRKLERRVPSALYYKMICPGHTGVPDRMIFLQGGKVIFVELKQPGKTERARQVYIHSQLRRLGFTVYSTVCTEQQIDEIVDTCESWTRIRGGEWHV